MKTDWILTAIGIDWILNSYFSVFSFAEMSLIKMTPNSSFASDKSRHQRKVKMTEKEVEKL